MFCEPVFCETVLREILGRGRLEGAGAKPPSRDETVVNLAEFAGDNRARCGGFRGQPTEISDKGNGMTRLTRRAAVAFLRCNHQEPSIVVHAVAVLEARAIAVCMFEHGVFVAHLQNVIPDNVEPGGRSDQDATAAIDPSTSSTTAR